MTGRAERHDRAVASAPYSGMGRRSGQWWPSRYGAGDELGGGNELTEERTLAALALPRRGRVIELAQTLTGRSPILAPRVFHHLVLAHGATSAMMLAPDGSQHVWLEEQATHGYHVGCHLDGLGHVGIDGRFYDGAELGDVYEPSGLTRFGIDRVRPWVARGVCLDIAAVQGVDVLPAGFVVAPSHLQAACERQRTEVRAGDAVFLNTGWGAKWEVDSEYGEVEPGAGWDAAHWLTDRRVSLVGADNWGFEVVPFESEMRPFVVHQHLLAETGTFIVENIRTDELVEGEHWEFLLVMAPNKVAGATASMVSPLAIV